MRREFAMLISNFQRIQANTERNENKATVGEFLNKQIEGIDNATSPSTIQGMNCRSDSRVIVQTEMKHVQIFLAKSES